MSSACANPQIGRFSDSTVCSLCFGLCLRSTCAAWTRRASPWKPLLSVEGLSHVADAAVMRQNVVANFRKTTSRRRSHDAVGCFLNDLDCLYGYLTAGKVPRRFMPALQSDLKVSIDSPSGFCKCISMRMAWISMQCRFLHPFHSH